jgi:lysozyme
VTLLEQLERHEGRRKFPYVDTVGKLTIGVGRNLTDRGLSDDEIDYLLMNDVREVLADLATFPWYAGLPESAKKGIADLRFNLGPTKFRKWTATIRYLERGDLVGAARQFRSNTRYFRQVGSRAERIARLIEGTEA